MPTFLNPNISHPRLRRLKKQIEGQNRGREEVKLKIEEIEEKVLRRERYLKVDIGDDENDGVDVENGGDASMMMMKMRMVINDGLEDL